MDDKTRTRMMQARQHIKAERYPQARKLLTGIDHPKARQWLTRLDEMSTPGITVSKSKSKTKWWIVVALVVLSAVLVFVVMQMRSDQKVIRLETTCQIANYATDCRSWAESVASADSGDIDWCFDNFG